MVRKTLLSNNIKNIGFNLKAQEKFIVDHGVIFEHYTAIPSPIGLKDRGDYRRPDSLDTFASNGFIYEKAGEFIGVLVSNNKDETPIEGGMYDNSRGRLILPKYYCNGKKPLAILPGDRVYLKDMDVHVSNYQRVNSSINNVDYLQFPAVSVQSLLDSNNNRYTCGVDFKITEEGNIQWVNGTNRPGIDPDTGNGRVYSIRYNYKAFWYVQQLLNEIRITNDGVGSNPERLPMHIMIQREYIYHNKVRDEQGESIVEEPRKVEEPDVVVDDNKADVKVDLRNFK